MIWLLATLSFAKDVPEAAAAVGVGTPAEIPGIPPGPPPPADQVNDIAREVGSKLRCPVCQGLSIADSQADTAVLIQARINELVAAGYSEQQIRDFFVARYGEWILLDPPASGLNWIIWLGPALGAGIGLAWAASVVTAWRREDDDVPLPSDQGLVDLDPYEKRLLEELE